MRCSLLDSSVHGILQARILEWVAMTSSRGSSWPRDRAWVSRTAGEVFTTESLGKPLLSLQVPLILFSQSDKNMVSRSWRSACSVPLLYFYLDFFFFFPFTVLIQLSLDSTAVCFFLVWIFVLEKNFHLLHFVSLRAYAALVLSALPHGPVHSPHIGSFKAFLVLRLAHSAFQLVSLVTVGHWKSSSLLMLPSAQK